MLISQIIETNFPHLTAQDKVSSALHLMEDYDLLHLPVIVEEKFAGLISKDDLIDADQKVKLATLQPHFIHASVLQDEHMISALKAANHFEISVIPVINKSNELQGIITQRNLVHSLAGFLNTEEPGGMIVLEMDKRNFSFGELCRLIETNDASITQLNTYTESSTGLYIVTIRINKMEISDIIATLQRYEYIIRYYFGEEEYENELRENYDLLMTYLKM